MSPKEITLCQKCRSTFRLHDHVLSSSLVTDLRNGIQIRTDAHAESIKRTLDGLQPKLCEYDAEIEALEETLAYLKKGRADLAHTISVYKTYLAPIRRLPLELLRKIFSEACAFVEFPIHNAREIQSPSQIPLRIASVCSRWRDICISFPQLWSVMFVNADDINLSNSTKFLLSLYQQRSSSKLTAIGISAQFLKIFRDTIDSILPYMSLKTLFSPLTAPIDLSSCHSLFLEVRLARQSDLLLPSPNFASLERLDLMGWTGMGGVDDADIFSTLFSDTPRLRELHLHDIVILDNFNFNWSRIHTLWIEQICYDIGWDHISDLFESLPSLDVLVFYDGQFDSATTKVTIPGIRVLQIWDGSGSTADLLDVMTLPDLRRLELLDPELGDPYHITTNDINRIVTFLINASLLNELRINMAVIQDVDLIQILEATPNLTKIAIVEPRCHLGKFSITEKLLERMMDAGSFLPKLEDLELVWAEDNMIEEGRVLDVIASRCGRLQSVLVGVRGGGELDKKALRRIQDFRVLGLTVRLY
ncbi:hypothetical protein EDD85DRAFT_853659 [Armillaria nabsnona]|nr:hypothetical protein EDD85DRAFT_853659 [Armillaria nabsnona]